MLLKVLDQAIEHHSKTYKDLLAKKLKLGYKSILGQVKTNKKYLFGMIWPYVNICPSSCLSAKRFFNRSAVGDLEGKLQ